MKTFARTMVAVATKVTPQLCFIPGANTMYPIPSKLTVLVAVVLIVSIANSSRVSALTYDWTNLSDEQLTNFSEAGPVSVAISGDIAVVGDEGGNYNRGEVKLFSRVSNGNWSQMATLTASDAAAYDQFGGSVGISGNTVLVGANGDQGNKGSAYLFTKPGGGWATATETAKLTSYDAAGGDSFGVSVGISGDTVLVGASSDADQGAFTGSAYLFTKPESGWVTTSTHAAKLTASDAAGGDYFGRSVGISGDTVVVGAWGDQDHGAMSGSAYLFTKPGASWATTSTHAAKLTASDGWSYDYFGGSVGISGDTVLVGANGDADEGGDTGSAYLFTKPESGWVTTSTYASKLTAGDAAAGDNFGRSVGISGDTVLVGANGKQSNTGSAYLFTKPGAGWATTSTHAAKLTAGGDATASDYFGDHVGIDGATGRVIVGNWPDAGAASAYIYEGTLVPEPSTGLLSLVGLAGCILARSRRRSARG